MRSTRHTATSRWLLALLLLTSTGRLAMAGDDGGSRYTGKTFASRSPVLAREGMAATSQPLATAVAVAISSRSSGIPRRAACTATTGVVVRLGG